MSIEFGKGILYMDDVLIGEINEIPTITSEPIYASLDKERPAFNFNVEASFSSDITYLNADLYNQLTAPATTPFKLYMDIPIMIQARWHKKPRIRKKWLKRYGMKPDTVKVEMDVSELTYTPGSDKHDELFRNDYGYVAPWDSFEFQTPEIKYIFRQDQLRRGIKIER